MPSSMAGQGSQAVQPNQTSAENGTSKESAIHAPTTATTQANKKSKGKKSADANDVSKALAAKISQLELDAAGEKDQDVEIGGSPSNHGADKSILSCMKELDLPQDIIAQAVKLLGVSRGADDGSKPSLQGGTQPQPLVADIAGMTDLLSTLPNLLDSAQQKLTSLPPGLIGILEREVKKATRDLTNLLNQMDNPMAKLETLQKKYSELLTDMRKMERENTKNKKRADLFQKEKDQVRSQHSKAESVKTRLESVCRELQRENKKLKEDQKRIESNEKASRDELSDRADSLFWELEEGLARQENPMPQQPQFIETDDHFRQHFKSFVEQYYLREQHVLSLLKTKDSEVQLCQTRLEDQRKRAEAETNKCRTLTAQVSTFSQTENELRSQLNIYVEKFKQVEDTLNNSNDLFLTFRKEMEEMSKKTKRLEKENLNLTRKHDLTNRNILEMAEERTKVNKDMEAIRKKNSTLESVIRRMQLQGRSADVGPPLTGDDEGTESDYDEEEEEYEDGSDEADYDDDTEDEALQADMKPPAIYGPQPPLPGPSHDARVNGDTHRRTNGEVSSMKGVVI